MESPVSSNELIIPEKSDRPLESESIIVSFLPEFEDDSKIFGLEKNKFYQHDSNLILDEKNKYFFESFYSCNNAIVSDLDQNLIGIIYKSEQIFRFFENFQNNRTELKSYSKKNYVLSISQLYDNFKNILEDKTKKNHPLLSNALVDSSFDVVIKRLKLIDLTNSFPFECK